MALDLSQVRWATNLEYDDVSGMPNRSTIPLSVIQSGWKRHQKSTRQWENQWRWAVGETINALVEGSSTTPRIFDNIQHVFNTPNLVAGSYCRIRSRYYGLFEVQEIGARVVNSYYRIQIPDTTLCLEYIPENNEIDFRHVGGVPDYDPSTKIGTDNDGAWTACWELANTSRLNVRVIGVFLIPTAQVTALSVDADAPWLIGEGWITSALFTRTSGTFITYSLGFQAKNLAVNKELPEEWNAQIYTPEVYTGIAFGTATSGEAQAAHCTFEDILVVGFKYSWWNRYGIWNSWKNIYSASLVGICFARNAFPDDQSNPEAPAGWNEGNGWFHNVIYGENMRMEDHECGIMGCPANALFTNLTTQYQGLGLAKDRVNKVLPVGMDKTGVYLYSGKSTQKGWPVTFNEWYAEGTRLPAYFVNQPAIKIDGWFTQGWTEADSYVAPIKLQESVCYVYRHRGQSWFTDRCILSNNSLLFGDLNVSSYGAAQGIVDSTSRWNKNGVHEAFIDKTTYSLVATGTPSSTMDFLVPDGITNAKNNSTFRVTVTGIYNGADLYIGEWLVRFLNSSNTFVSKVHYANKSGPANEWVTFQWGNGGYAPYFTASNEFTNQFEVIVERVSDMRSFTVNY